MEKIINYLDYQFYLLQKEIKELSPSQLFEKIKANYKSLPLEIKKILENYFDRFSFWGSLHEKQNDFNEIEIKAKTLSCHIDDFVWLYNKLSDYSSKHLLFSILNNFVNYDFKNLGDSIKRVGKHYFDFDILPKCENEVFVDLGAYTGDTVLDFLNCYSIDCYNKIYCYEITPSVFEILKKNLSPYKNIVFNNKAASNENGFISVNDNLIDKSANTTICDGSVKIKSVCIDEDIKEKITIIKMDIEGDEEKALVGCKNHIKDDSPVLMISIYHNNDHYWKIPKLIYKFNKKYNFYLRNFGGELYPTEIVLYAIPKTFNKKK